MAAITKKDIDELVAIGNRAEFDGQEITEKRAIDFLADFAERVRKDERERAWLAPCEGCPEGHSSFWRTVVMSPQWKAWEGSKEVYMKWDVDERRECGWISEKHFQEFLKFCALIEINKGDVK